MASKPTYEELELRVEELEREAEVELRRSEELSSKLLAAIPDIVVRMDMEGNILFVNDVALQISGYSLSEITGMNMLSFIAPEDQDKAVTNTFLMLEKRLGPQEYHMIMKDGRKLLFEVNGDVLRDQNGTPYGIVHVCRDITERKRTEEALAESEKKYRHLVQYAPTGIYEIDWENGRFLSVNDVMCDLSGYSREELLTMSPLDLIEKESQELFIERRLRSMAGEKIPENAEFKAITKDGRFFWASIYSRLVYEDGKPVRAQVVAHDVTERRLVEEKLRKSEEKYRLLADNINDNIWILDLESLAFTYVSQSVQRITGFSAEEAVGLTLEQVLTPASLELAARVLAEELNQEKLGADPNRSRNLEVEQKTKAGGTVWTEISVKFIRDEKGRAEAVLGVTRDISQRKALQAQLQQAQKMEAIGTLASGIAHDFNNILQAISGNVQLVLNQKELDQGLRRHIDEIDTAVNRAVELIHRLLTSSRKVEPKLQALDVVRELDSALAMLKRTIPRMIGIETIVPPETSYIRADPNQFGQVIMNLGANARDAMPDGGRLVFEASNQKLDDEFCRQNIGAHPGDYVRLTVSDTGQGMNEETLKQIFHPFYTTKEVGKGTGLGLTVIYGIVKNHGGYISCSSRPGEGSEFTIYWPAAAAEKTPRPEDRAEDEDVPGGRETVLLVDDEESIIEVAREFLMGYGYRVLKAASGEEALDIYAREGRDVDLVLLDLGMPGIGGHKALVELLAANPSARVLIASGYSTDNQVRKALQAGAAGFIAKPYRLKDLLRKIREILDG